MRFLIRRLPCVAAGGHFSCAADAICANWLPLPPRPRATSFHQIDLSFNGISRFSPIGNQQAGELLLIRVISNLPIYNQGRSARQTHFLTSHLPVCLSVCLSVLLLLPRRLTFFGQSLFGNAERWPLQCELVFAFAYLCEFQVCYFKHRGGGGIGNALACTRLARWSNLPVLFCKMKPLCLSFFLSFFHWHRHTHTHSGLPSGFFTPLDHSPDKRRWQTALRL